MDDSYSILVGQDLRKRASRILYITTYLLTYKENEREGEEETLHYKMLFAFPSGPPLNCNILSLRGPQCGKSTKLVQMGIPELGNC